MKQTIGYSQLSAPVNAPDLLGCARTRLTQSTLYWAHSYAKAEECAQCIHSRIRSEQLLRILIYSLFLLCFTHLSFALPEDREKIMQLRADTAEISQETHRGIYIGNVQLDQGTTHVRAAEAITESNSNNKLMLALAKGNQKAQAHYWTQTAKDKPPLHAYADAIYYYPDQHLIKLIGNARIEQGKDSFSAPKITYDTLSQHVKTSRDDKKRTLIVIHPEKSP